MLTKKDVLPIVFGGYTILWAVYLMNIVDTIKPSQLAFIGVILGLVTIYKAWKD